GRGLRRAVADHRLQPLYRPWHRYATRPGAAEARRAIRPLAALPLQPGASGGREPTADDRLEGAQRSARAVCLQRDALPDTVTERRGALRGADSAGEARCERALGALPTAGRSPPRWPCLETVSRLES